MRSGNVNYQTSIEYTYIIKGVEPLIYIASMCLNPVRGIIIHVLCSSGAFPRSEPSILAGYLPGVFRDSNTHNCPENVREHITNEIATSDQ